MSIKATKNILLRIKNQSDLRNFVIDLFKEKVIFEVLSPNDLEGTKSIINHYKHNHVSKSHLHLKDLVQNIVDKQLSLRGQSPFDDTRFEIKFDELFENSISYENIYKLEKAKRNLEIIDPNSLQDFCAYLSNVEFEQKLNDILSLAFNFSDSQDSESGWYLCVSIPVEDSRKLDILADKYTIREIQIEWKNKISVWNTNSIIKPYQQIASDLGSVSRKDIDPTLMLSVFFSIFFGFCVADAVYGIVLTVVSAYLWFFTKAKAGILNMSKIFFFSGIASTIVGVLSGSWAGDLISRKDGALLNTLGIEEWGIFNFLRSLQVVDPIDAKSNVPFNNYLEGLNLNPIVALLGLSILIGLVTLFSGYILKTVNMYKNGNRKEGNESIVWLIFLISILTYSGSLVYGDSLTINLSLGLIAFSLFLVFFVNTGKGIGGKIASGFGTLWGLIGFLADTLSFTRLIAVGLTGGIIGSVINLLATLLFSAINIPFLNLLILIILLLAGHGFNFVITIFGAYINPLRLSYVEYLPKFIGGNERNLEPEMINLTYNKLKF